jgi:malonyl-CoA/methylmalonyl-CoA synthetase
VSGPRSIPEAFLASVARHPDKPCLLFEGRTHTYADLRTAAFRWAEALRAWGLVDEDRVALFLENSPTFVAAYLGIQMGGGIVVLVNTQYRQVELRHILQDAGVRLVVTDPAGRAEIERVASELVSLDGIVTVGKPPNEPEPASLLALNVREQSDAAFLAGAPGAEPPALPESDAVAVLGYTSGTTGRSKGAMLTHRNLASNAVAITDAWRWTADDRLLLALPLFHAHGLFNGVHGTLLTGATADLRRKFDAADAFDTLLRGETTMFFGVPTMYTRLIAEARKRNPASRPEGPRPPPIRLYVSGSAPLSPQTFEEFAELFGQPILERYGMTETIMNLTNPYDGERRPGTVGMAFPGQEARIVDVQTRKPIEDETPGEIQVRGPHVFKGYWQRPDATEEAFDAEGWFNTGDLGWRSKDGYYTISGRARELIISGGFNVYPREVEEVLESHPAVAEAAVVGLPHPDFGEQVVAAVVTRADVATDELVDFCKDQLASFKKPRQVFVVKELPRNALGKVQKHVLRESLLKT